MLLVTSVTASVLGLLLVKLSINVIGYRRNLKITVGDGGNDLLYRASRAQANLAEYAPIGLILLACLELNGAPLWLTVLAASLLVVGRFLHPIGIKSAEAPWQPRVFGMVLTFTSLLVSATANLFIVVSQLVSQ